MKSSFWNEWSKVADNDPNQGRVISEKSRFFTWSLRGIFSDLWFRLSSPVKRITYDVVVWLEICCGLPEDPWLGPQSFPVEVFFRRVWCIKVQAVFSPIHYSKQAWIGSTSILIERGFFNIDLMHKLIHEWIISSLLAHLVFVLERKLEFSISLIFQQLEF